MSGDKFSTALNIVVYVYSLIFYLKYTFNKNSSEQRISEITQLVRVHLVRKDMDLNEHEKL
jgi:hypothetical protein